MMKLLISFGFLSALAQDINTPQCPGYAACIQENDIYIASTCQPMTNATMNAVCMCYANVNRDLCSLQCPNDPQIQNAAAAFKNTVTASCAAVNLNPKALPPAPWVTYRPSQSMTATTTSIQGSPTSSPTTVIPARNQGNGLNNIGIALFALIAMFFAI